MEERIQTMKSAIMNTLLSTRPQFMKHKRFSLIYEERYYGRLKPTNAKSNKKHQ